MPAFEPCAGQGSKFGAAFGQCGPPCAQRTGVGSIGQPALRTAAYMSPEMLLGESYGTSTDIWSYGVPMSDVCALLAPCATLRLPFWGWGVLCSCVHSGAIDSTDVIGSGFITVGGGQIPGAGLVNWGPA